ncbi:hypothetical protein T07_2511 [Trichinella nelsoni]|uniref:Uncharacterized protein n=1 Tax=Trichinella nelsoni TaxID=6336 RepID=A0A0V0RG27_9BILA|nr:hypothetical protein T07_2511 [Trichinella nelsoni]
MVIERRILLTVRKALPMYSRIFEVLLSKAKELEVQLDPAKFVCDFERDLILAVQGNFPNTRVQSLLAKPPWLKR